MKSHHKRSLFKRLVLAVIIPIGLFLLSLFFIQFLGKNTSHTIIETLDKLWLPISIIRLIVYIFITYFIVPLWITKKQTYINTILTQLNTQMDSCTEESLQLEYQQLHLKQQRYEQLLSYKYWIFIFLILFDVLTIQIPFILH